VTRETHLLPIFLRPSRLLLGILDLVQQLRLGPSRLTGLDVINLSDLPDLLLAQAEVEQAATGLKGSA